MVLSFGWVILRRLLQLMILVVPADRANAVEVLRHQVVALRRQVGRGFDGPSPWLSQPGG